DKKIIHLSDNEVFLDGGAYDGDTIRLIIKESKNRFKNIFAFEPDNKNYKKINNYVRQLKDSRIKIFRLGLGDKNNTLSFTNEGNLQSKVIKYGKIQIKIVPIDKYIDEHFTYIKLDIEGFEKKALIGAKKTIKKYKPKLVICSYHNLNDIWELTILIKKFRPDYKIFLRHYSDFLMDTICYAV
ncbi:FkbM family methyltransferase, partial [Candidatus Gracilibacteria bacterium]|nr:FkbM family methyltransferase [Candidatus Gracilibacteria bacterium]